MLLTEYLNITQTPFNYPYLRRLDDVLQHALDEYPRTLSIQVTLRLSPHWEFADDDVNRHPYLSEAMLSCFINSLRARIRHYRQRVSKRSQGAHACRLRYFWVQDTEEINYYHVILFLDNNLFRWGDDYPGEMQSLERMIQEAWLRALDLRGYDNYRKLVHIPEKGGCIIDRHSPHFERQLARLIYRSRYLVEENIKADSGEERSMGCSQY